MRRPAAILAVLASVAVAAGCGHEKLPDPPQTDEALAAGRALSLPVSGEWPRIGLQWTYEVTTSGFATGVELPARIAYRLTAREDAGHPWAGWWMYGAGRGMEFTGATIEEGHVFFHPPRLFGFAELEFAPFPEAAPGRAGRSEGNLTLGQGYGGLEGKVVRTVHRDVGWEPVEVPAGRFERAWLVEAEATAPWRGSDWKARLHWCDRVGWVALEWTAADGRRITMRLASLRDVGREG